MEIRDENGNRSREYKDKLGLTVLRRVYTDKNNSNSNLDTYYVYDDLSRVRFVLQPAYQDQANGSHYFYYEYNDRGLMIKKGVPGGGITELTYNERDLLSESKDGTTTITYYKYDALNRLTETGEKQGGSEVPLSRRYYDSYPSGVTGFSNIGESGYPTSRRSNVKGLVTATATRILNPDGSKGSTWYYTAYYYNDRLQLIQTTRQLFDLGSNAVEYTTLSLRFDGRVEKQMITQQVVTGTNSVEEVYTYDHADRVLAVRNTIKKENTVKVDTWQSAMRYNDIGLLKNKYLHSANGTDYRQRLTHTYTPRSWLKKIEGETGLGANFGVELKYTDPSAGAAAQYNGNMAEMLWRRSGSWVGYKFGYDGADRLLAAEGIAGNNYKEYDITYDKNGNINTLKRGEGATVWDNLTYTYDQGRLNTVTDGSGSGNGVKNGTSVYQFDNAGNLTLDGNRNATISYNLLHLPRQIQVNGQTVQYHYDGAGTKQRMSNTNGTVNTKYAGIFEYNESNYLTRIATTEGQIAVTSNGNTYTANYYLKDHLGNVRTVINGEGTILQETEYFAFGLAIPRSGNDAVNRYQFLNREKQPETGYMDLVRRFYDPSIGRFMQVDPVTEGQENYSTYQYGWNNPILRSDPNGDCPDCWEFIKGVGRGIGSGAKGTWQFATSDAWKADTWKATGNLALGLAAGGTDVSTLMAVDNALGTNTLRAMNALGTSVDNTLQKVASGNPGAIGEVTGGAIWAGVEIAAGSRGAGLISKSGKGASIASKVDVVAAAEKGLGNPFKNATLSQVDEAFQVHVQSGKLELKYTNPKTGAKAYQNTKSGYSYNLDPGGMYGKKLESPHIDVNYSKPKPANFDKKKLPVSGGF